MIGLACEICGERFDVAGHEGPFVCHGGMK